MNRSTFSIPNYTLRKYLVKLLNYHQLNSESLAKLKNNLDDPYVLSLIGSSDYKSIQGLERENFVNKLLADVRYLGDETMRHISYAARNLRYEHQIEDNMNNRELFTTLRSKCVTGAQRKAFNALIKIFDFTVSGGALGAGASLSSSGIAEQGPVVNKDQDGNELTDTFRKFKLECDSKDKRLMFNRVITLFVTGDNVHYGNRRSKITEELSKLEDKLNKETSELEIKRLNIKIEILNLESKYLDKLFDLRHKLTKLK